jgi:hypothetical protein
VRVERFLRPDEEPHCNCGHDGSMNSGCVQCTNRIAYENKPVRIKCPLCKGAKRLRYKPTPITAVVDWTLGSPTSDPRPTCPVCKGKGFDTDGHCCHACEGTCRVNPKGNTP